MYTRRTPGGLIALAASLLLAVTWPVHSPVSHARSIASAPGLQVTPAEIARVDSTLATLTRERQFSGAVLIAQDGQILLSKGYGMADWAGHIHNTSDTVFLIPALQFEFIAVAILQLEDAGKVQDQGHLCTYLPHCPATWAPITIHELLDQTSGLHDIVNRPTLGEGVGLSYSLAQSVSFVMREPLEHRPGAGLNSNVTGTDPVGEYLIQQVSGESFGRYVHDHFARPLGLRHTGYYLHVPLLSRHAVGYQSWQVPASPIEDFDMSLDGGMMYSTLTDLFRWEEAVYSGQVLSAATTARLLAPAYISCSTTAGCGSGYSTGGTSEGLFAVTRNHQRLTVLTGGIPDAGFHDASTYFTASRIIEIRLLNLNVAFPSLLQMLFS